MLELNIFKLRLMIGKSILTVLLLFLISTAVQTQPFKANDLNVLLTDSSSSFDQDINFSRTVSRLFHEKINDYRISKKQMPLRWNDTLWLVALNHSIYIDNNKDFNHRQNRKKKMYSGETPDNRYQFVLNNESTDVQCGENIFQWSSTLITAESLCNLMFESWKKSSGHNKNMLSHLYIEHGMAIYAGKQGITCTNVFLASDVGKLGGKNYLSTKSSKRKFRLSLK